MRKVTIADCAFLPHVKSASVGQDNSDAKPEHFEWEFCEPQTSKFVTDGFIPHASGKGQIGWLLEPFCLHPECYLTALGKNFDYVLTHNRYFSDNYGWLWHPFGGSWVAFKDWGIHEKTRDVSMILSYKNSLPGHKKRHEAAERYGDMMDAVFGLNEYVTHFQGLSSFRYSVVIESESSYSFFNEKIIGCFALGTIPIYWGCKDIGNYFNPEGIIQFDYLDELPNILAEADERHYLDKLSAVKENLEIARYYSIPENWIYAHYPFLFEKG